MATAIFDEPVTVNAITVAPYYAPNGYGPFKVECSPMKSTLVFEDPNHVLDFYNTLKDLKS